MGTNVLFLVRLVAFGMNYALKRFHVDASLLIKDETHYRCGQQTAVNERGVIFFKLPVGSHIVSARHHGRLHLLITYHCSIRWQQQQQQ